jgi:hypothetical protein
MKKIVIAVSMLAAALVANAQEPAVQPATRLYKPVAGNVLAEIGLFATPGGITGGVTSQSQSAFGTPQLKFRYFLQDQIALRVGFNYTQNTETTKFYEANPGSGDGFAKDKSSLFGLNLGIEKHLTGTGRLSTYVGGDLSFILTGASAKWENTANGTTFTDGASRKIKGGNAAGDRGSFGFGLRAVGGADYYFVEKVYLGAEFGWGFIASKEGKLKDEQTLGGVTTTTETKSGGGEFNIAPSLTAGLRLGFIF